MPPRGIAGEAAIGFCRSLALRRNGCASWRGCRASGAPRVPDMPRQSAEKKPHRLQFACYKLNRWGVTRSSRVAGTAWLGDHGCSRCGWLAQADAVFASRVMLMPIVGHGRPISSNLAVPACSEPRWRGATRGEGDSTYRSI